MKKLFVLVLFLFLVSCDNHVDRMQAEPVALFPEDLDRAKTVCSIQQPASKVELVEVSSTDNCVGRLGVQCTLHVNIKVHCFDKTVIEYNTEHDATTRRDLL